MEQLTIVQRAITILLVLLYMGAILLWEHFNGGVGAHYFLQDETMPRISNYWNLLVGALLSWITLLFVRRRMASNHKAEKKIMFKTSIKRFMAALLFGWAISISFLTGQEIIINVLMIALVVSAFIFPVYYPEHLLGYVLGLTYAVGSVIPLVFGMLLMVLFYGLYHFPRWGFQKLKRI